MRRSSMDTRLRTDWKRYVDQLSEHAILREHHRKAAERRQRHGGFRLPEGDAEKAREALSAAGAGTEALLCAAWGVLLLRYLRAEQTAFAVIRSAGRAMPLVVAADGHTPLNGIVKHAEAELHRLDSEPVSLEELAGLLDLAGPAPVLNTAVLLGDSPPPEQPADMFDLIVAWREDRLEAWYQEDAYSPAFVGRLLGHLGNIIAVWLNDPGRAMGAFGLLSEEELHRLDGWNRTEVPYPSDRTIHELIEEQARRTPDHAAVVWRGETLTYRELDDRAGRVARELVRLGAGPGRIVAIAASPSPEMVVGVLGILKSGAAYLPIDPSYPADRIAYMLEDSGAGICLTEPNARLDGSVRFAGKTVCVKEASGADGSGGWNGSNGSNGLDRQACPDEPDRPNGPGAPGVSDVGGAGGGRVKARPDDLAYVIYTSGSTGRPKGVMIEHRSLVNLCFWHVRQFGVTGQDRAIKYAGFGFDASVWEMFPYLITGASLHVIPEEMRLDAGGLHAYFRENGITIGFLPTQFCEYFMAFDNPSLRVLLTGGDKLKTFRRQQYALYNCYGPTENTVVTTWYPVTEQRDNIPIGYPVDNTRVFIVDAYGHPQPVGVPGELCIAGAGLARGYLNRPELTAEKFAPGPLAGGGRMYRTGDLARWNEEGAIEFLGRIDHQVKIRGFRIETGEIEHRLLEHEAVSEAVVVGLDDATGAKYLCAYIVADRKLTHAEIASFLTGRLPDYMVPARLVQLDALPVNANGKVDRRALPAPDEGDDESRRSYTAPEGETELAVAALWRETIGGGRVGADESFFAAGGDSMKAVVLRARLERRFGIRVPIPVLFERTTIREQAEWIARTSAAASGAAESAASGGVAESAGLSGAAESAASGSAAAARAAAQPVTKARERGEYPVTPAQRRLYFIEQLEQTGTAYNCPFVFRIDGTPDRDRLEQSIRGLIARHDALRASFHWKDDDVVQKVHAGAPFDLETTDASEDRLDAFIRGLIRPFDLTRAPLMRAWLIRLDRGNRHALVFDFHHIVVDGLSANALFDELSALYRGEALPELHFGFADYAVWRQETASRRSGEELQAYWRRALHGELPVLHLPMAKERPAGQSFAGDTVTLRLDADLSGRLKRLARDAGATPFMVLFAAYQAVLFRYSGQEDIITGVPVLGRTDEELQRLVGMFVNTLPVRVFPEKDKPFAGFLREVKAALLDAFEHQDCDLEELVRTLRVPRHPGRNPLFDTLFVMQNTGRLELRLDGTDVSVYPYAHPISKYDLLVDVNEEERGFRIDLQFCTALLTREDIDAFGRRFTRLLSDAAAYPEKTLGELDFVEPEEYERVVFRFNDTASRYREEATIHRLVEEQAERTPDKAALTFGDRTMTYRELNERANRLAHTLRAKGVLPDQVVGLMARRSFEMIVGLLAILKAGGAYVPIDPEYPRERIAHMLANSGARLLLTEKALDGKAPFDGETLLLDDERVYGANAGNPEHVNRPGDLLYVIYTSGTTGKPKGVMIEHRNMANLLHHMFTGTNVDYGGNVLQFTTISFDVCSQEIWSTLAAGGTLHLITNELRMNVGGLLDFVEKRGIDILFIPVSFLKFILNEPEYAGRFPSTVKHIITAGEQLIVPEKFRAHLKKHGIFLHNHYGPSETHVVTAHTIDPDGFIPELPPIGKPIANTQIYIVNDRMQPQPVGVAGELCIAGHNVGRGYMGNEALTGERYLPNPFAPGGRLYKTGDLARWTPEGTIEFLGRLDHQVKIRGFRIELGEVENGLLAHPLVKETIVVAKDDGRGGKYLCAYFVARRELTAGELREHLGKTLPDYMIPSHFVQLPSMPLTPNGKIDRKALPEPDASHGRSEAYVPPSTEKELAVAEVWREVLQVGRIGANDNFFELGGHSLKAAVVVARLQKRYEIRMNDMFEHQTVAALAGKIKPRTDHLRSRLEKIKQARMQPAAADWDRVRAEYERLNERYAGLDLTEGNGYRDVLLTGATGYLGAHLLHEMMTGHDWNVHAIVRAGSDEEAMERLRRKCGFYFGEGWFEQYADRIFAHAGDLAEDRLGLGADRYEALSRRADAVFHAAANVKHYGSYGDFERQNVTATANLLAFAATGKRKDMHHMSTLGVASGAVEGRPHVVFTEYDLDVGQSFENYYARSKFEAERLVAAARERGIAANIYRLGNIACHSGTGRFQENIADNAFYATLKSFLALGAAPEDDQSVDLTFVDAAGKAVVLLAERKALLGETFHLANPHAVRVGDLLRDNPLGVEVGLMPFDRFVDHLYERYEDEPVKRAIENIMLHYGWMEETAMATRFDILSGKTERLLSRLGFRWPLPDRERIAKMFAHGAEMKYFRDFMNKNS